MSEESEAPATPKLRLSSSKSTPSPNNTGPESSTQEKAPATSTTPPQAAATPVTPPALPKIATQSPVSQHSAKKTVNQINKPQQKESHLASILVIVALLLILGAAGGGIWYILQGDVSSLTEESASTDTDPVKTTPAEPAPVEAAPVKTGFVNSIQRTKETIAEVPAAQVNDILKSEVNTKSKAEVTHHPEPAYSENHKEAVSDFLSNVHIGGVRTGVNARIMLNGQNYELNDTVYGATGLTFIGTQDQKLLFRDRNGVIYVKSF
jgi:flagellar basal body-associated protein FliL